MIDIHAHLLPRFDDGADSFETAVEMCRMAAEDGVETIVATPHFHRTLFDNPEPEDALSRLEELRGRCEAAGIELRILFGSDCHLHPELADNLKEGSIPTVNQGRYLLLEFPSDTLPPEPRELIFRVKMEGVTPIVTHPERNPVLASRPEVLRQMIDGGAYAQVTAASLTGLFGRQVRTAAEMMVSKRLVQVIASDAHDTERRPPTLSEGRDAAAALIGEELAGRMVRDVPLAVIEDRPIDFPPPVEPEPRRYESWWNGLRRLLGR